MTYESMFTSTSPSVSRKRRRMQRRRQQKSQEIGISRTLVTIFSLTVVLQSPILTLVVAVSGFVMPLSILQQKRTYENIGDVDFIENIVDITTNCQIKRHREVFSTVLFYETGTSTTSTQPTQPTKTTTKSVHVYNQEKTTQRHQKHQYQRDQSTTLARPTPTTAHYYPSSSRQKKGTSRKIQLRWITQAVQKLISRNHSNLAAATYNSTITNNDKNDDENSNDSSDRLLEGLELLCIARTQTQVIEAGRLIESAHAMHTQSIAIQERIIKATAMTGLLHIALQMMDHMVQTLQYLPSPICQDAVSDGLRRVGRVHQLNQLLSQLGSVANQQNKSISLITFNTYLAALCDVVTGKDDATHQQQQQQSLGGFDISVMDTDASNYKVTAIDRAWYCIADLDRTKQTMAITPDSVSYATVIQAAASIGNQTIVDAVWNLTRTRNVHPNIVAYNARLRSSTYMNGGSGTSSITSSRKGKSLSRLGREKQSDQEILKIWDTEISSDPYVSTDKYTIDLLLLPLIRLGRVGDVESLLDNFVKRNSDSVVSNAFTAFLLTVVAGGEISTARALFEMYILPTLSPVVFGDAGGMIRMVRPTTRHFNVLIEGYRKYFYQNKQDRFNNDTTTSSMMDATVQAWSLYDIMTKSLHVQPDSYTTTSMMGLCRTSTELSDLIVQSISNFNIECSSVVLRAALTTYGDLGDASSAIWLFSTFAPTTARTWNVLLGALAKVSENSETFVVVPSASTAAMAFQDSTLSHTSDAQFFGRLLQATNLFDGVQLILKAMCNQDEIDGTCAPSADSQTFCVAAAALQYGSSTGSILANEMFDEAAKLYIPADGRFVNAAVRCFGNEIDAALIAWRDKIRPKCVAYERRLSTRMSGNKNLYAAYNGLLHVCGRALRPDIALRVVYAMNKDGIEPNETSLNSYRSGSRMHQKRTGKVNEIGGGFRMTIERTLNLREQFESLLVVECTKYDQNDRRRDGEQRVRIIL